MFKPFIFFAIGILCCAVANAAVLDVESALRATYNNCVGIDGYLQDMKVKAGISTAVAGAGTAMGIGATVVGIVKSKTDVLIEEKYKLLENLSYGASGDVETLDSEEWLKIFQESSENNAEFVVNSTLDNASNEQIEQIRALDEKSKKLGNWRTGLMAGNTATNIAGVVLSGKNKVDISLSEQIQNCKVSLQNLRRAIAQARIDGIDVAEAINIESVCQGLEYVDADNIARINNLAKGGMVSSAVGTGTGVVGVITSVLANSDKVRKDDSNQGRQKEKNLNVAANVLAVGGTLASATATIFNATQIKVIKDFVDVTEKCSEALR